MSGKRRRAWRGGLAILIAAGLSYGLLSIPGAPPAPVEPASRVPFVWDADQTWAALERRFVSAREAGCEPTLVSGGDTLDALRTTVRELVARGASPDDSRFDTVERLIFEAALLAAACPEQKASYLAAVRAARVAVKRVSGDWDMSTPLAKRRLYRLLYGARVAEEEVLLQTPLEDEALVRYGEVPSKTPFADVHGLRVRSGDLLVSRGGAATSALIARGNDYPGNFSHVALVYVDPVDRVPSVIEAHIERGVAIASAEQYLADTKLRILVLRPRPDLKALVEDPMLPHRAAQRALERARREHIPYDFEMDFDDPSALFCSEVASFAYAESGVTLWMGMSTMSSAGLTRWLSQFGVRHFTTQAPSDLEYDPQLALVAEWRDPQTLFKDHVDNAVIDAALELADKGRKLDYERALLPVARLLKAYSAVLNLFGGVGPIPEGMSATAALKNESFSAWHAQAAETVNRAAARFEKESGYRPPYWKLVEFAREAVVDSPK